jgi:hypothetical protein
MTKIIDVSDEGEPLPKGYDFSPPEPDLDLGPDASVFDSGPISRMDRQLVGIAPKPTDPAVDMMVKTFLSRHGLRLVGFFPKVRAGKFLCNGPQRGLGLTRFPLGATTTKAGDRWVTSSEEARLRRYKPIPGEAAYAAQEKIRRDAGVYEDRLSVQGGWMSLADGKYSRLSWAGANKAYRQAVPESQKLPKEGELPERHCQNPECLKEIGAKRHHNVQYCNAKCTARAKELRRLDRKNQKAGRPIHYRNESDVSDDLINDTSQLETRVISPHTSRRIFSKDCAEEVAAYQQ